MYIDDSLHLPTGPKYTGVLSHEEMVAIVGKLIQKLKLPAPDDCRYPFKFRGYEWKIHTGDLHTSNYLYPCTDADISIARRIINMNVPPGQRRPEEVSYAYFKDKWECKDAWEQHPRFRELRDDEYSFVINFVCEAFYYMDLQRKKAKEIDERIESILNCDHGFHCV